MSSPNINSEFSEFGSRMYAIAILTLISFVLGIASWVVSIPGWINAIVGVLIFIFFLLVLGDIKAAGLALNNRNLLEFRSKIIACFILGIIGTIFLALGVGALIALIYYGYYPVIVMLILGVIALIGIIMLLVSAILKIQAWSRLKTFFETNATLFPQNIANDAKSGANLCRIGAILDITIILAFIGDILRVVGYFKLASLKDLKGAPAQPVVSQQQPIPKTATKFCPSCGSPITQGVKYCPNCGAEIS